MEKTAKEALFGELHHLEEPEDGEYCSVDAVFSRNKISASRITHEAITPQEKMIRGSSSNHVDNPATPKISSTSHDTAGPLKSISFSVIPSSVQSKQQEVDSTEARTSALATRNMPKATGKRKRGESFEVKPESQQVFKGSSFFFVPNDDISPTRKFRIRKAMEFGALWVRQWREGITHVIVDNGISYQDVMKYLNVSALPTEVALVNETYPSHCLMYRYMMDPDQPHYRIKGHEVAPTIQPSSTPMASSETSLQLKPEKGKGLPPQQSPSRTEVSDQPSLEQGPNLDADSAAAKSPALEAQDEPAPPNTALDEAIVEAKAIQDLPLDEDTSADVTDADTSGDSSSEAAKAKPRTKKPSSTKSWQDNFSCMSAHDGTVNSSNPNAKTIEILQRMADYYSRTQDHWRLTAYRRAIAALRKQTRKITTAKEALAIPFIGQRLADKIEEIVWTNRLRRLENTESEPHSDALQLFMKIYGVGLKQATKWVDQGYRSIADLLSKASLTKNQRIGIDHLEDFQSRIPRREMDRHDQYVRDFCSKIDPTLQFTIGGSYRRGAADSGDIDFIVTKPNCSLSTLRTILLDTVIPALFKENYLKTGLATTAQDSGSKWHGAAALPSETIWRRIDFLLVPWDEMGAALIYFTGNDIFNRSIRLLASKKGMRLNQRGLWKDVLRGPGRERVTQGTLVESRDERRIFEELGVPWRPPGHRIC